ncbi:DUF7933 domain-containing protein [Arthrobacter glacialis]|uniref:Uncharacterized protein n=1 Tax=Arthrobacter glacialis TaxID=1664 RepID=A0A2S3ZV28_ARTGL|nr:Ig-like domain-containing protein [Arthrobacter glacialis]POH73115.1 hypothetical protein CVS27_11305 [Arthrobacter glacialis]
MTSISKRPPIGRTLVTAGALIAAAFTPLLAAPAATAAVPQEVLFEAKFENTGTQPVLLTNYSSIAPNGMNVTYTANPGWLRACNGNILAGNSSPDDLALTNCNLRSDPALNARAYQSLRQLANALGQYRGNPAPETNHVLAAFTDGENPGMGEQLRSSVINIGGENRYVALSVDGAALNCASSGPNYKFSIVNGTTNVATPLGSSALCTDPGAVNITAPGLEGGAARTARVATVDSALATKFTGSSLRAVIENLNGSGSGNDAAVDNMRIVDVTPTLEKSFSTPVNTVGDRVGVVFKINNTTELLAKDGWDFTDTLPAGMTVADPALTVACVSPAGGAVTPSAVTTTAVTGGNTIRIAGGIPNGADSCTVSIQVRGGTAPGSYTNGPSNVVANFLNVGQFAPATTTFAAPADAPESTSTPFNTPVTIDPFANFAPVPADATPTTANRNTFLFSNGQTSMSTAAGAWSYDSDTGLIMFSPASGYVGTTPAMPYTYQDSNNNLVTSTATIVVGGDIIDLSGAGDQGQPVTVPLTGQTSDIDPASARIIDPATNSPTTSPLVVAGEGTWTVNSAGSFTFNPEAGFQSNPTPIRYTATDGTGAQVTHATVTVLYPNVSDAAGAGDQGQPVTVPAALDPGMDPATVQLINPATGNSTKDPVISTGEGTWTVNDAGDITFTPEAGFGGDPTPIKYTAEDGDGNLALPGTVTITYAVGAVIPPAPVNPSGPPVEPADPGHQGDGIDLADTGTSLSVMVGLLAFLLLGSGVLLAVRSRRGVRQS